jgi:hypothetical protein
LIDAMNLGISMDGCHSEFTVTAARAASVTARVETELLRLDLGDRP